MGRNLLLRGQLDLSLNFDPKHTPKSTNINLQTPKPRSHAPPRTFFLRIPSLPHCNLYLPGAQCHDANEVSAFPR